MLFGAVAETNSSAVSAAAPTYSWSALPVGAGGWITGVSMSKDASTTVIRTDTYGAYRLVGSRWKQLVTAQSLPSSDVTTDIANGVYEIVVAPSDPQRLYMAFAGALYRSNNAGDAWTKTSLLFPFDPNDGTRMYGTHIAVDPNSADRVIVGTPGDGLQRSNDGGTTWVRTSVPSASSASTASMTGVMIANDGTMFVGSRGNGVYRSTDGGLTWNRPAGGPSTVERADVGPDSSYVAVTDGATHDVWRLVGTTWTKITPAGGRTWHSVTVDPFNANRIVVADDGGAVTQTTNAGATWGSIIYNATRATCPTAICASTRSHRTSCGSPKESACGRPR
jgi:hypothetical protein